MFITFEGSEGSGKSSQILALADFLNRQGHHVITTREPGGTPIGEQIRSVQLNPANTEMHLRTEILLFQASRAQLVEEVIRPHLARGGIVLSDRYADSTLAYQGYGYRRIDLDSLRALIHFATGGLKPDLTLFLDVEVREGLRRRSQDGDANRLDSYDVDFYERVRQGYLEMVATEPDRWVCINASQPPDQVQEAVRRAVLARLGEG
jgi:dTMP kinase